MELWRFNQLYANLPMQKRLVKLNDLGLSETTVRDIYKELKAIEDRKCFLLETAEKFFIKNSIQVK